MKDGLNHTIISFDQQMKEMIADNKVIKERMIEVNKTSLDVKETLEKNYVELDYRIRRCLVPPKWPTLSQIREGD